MPNLTANINFTAVFDTAARTLTLQNTGNYAGVSVNTRWVVRLVEMGVVRTAVGQLATLLLPTATDGTIPQLVYEITCTVSDGTDDSTLTRSFAYAMLPQQPELSQFLDYTTPRLTYSDAQEYFQEGYNIPGVARSWSALRSGQTVPVTSNSAVLDLAVAGNYYVGQYAVGLTVTATYQPKDVTKQWVTVVATYTAKDAVVPYVWPTLSEILGWVNAADEKCGTCEPGCNPAYLYGLFKDNYCNGNYEAAERNLQALYKATHNGQRYKPRQDGGLLVAVEICGAQAPVIVPPNILSLQQSPTSVSVGEGDTVTYSTVATVTNGAISYQWQVSTDGINFTNISGATAASFSFTAQLSQDSNNYRCVLTGIGTTPASVTTNNAGLTVTVAGLQPPTLGAAQRSGNTASIPVTAASGADSSVVQASTDPNFGGTPLTGTIANGAATFTGLATGTLYYYRGYSVKAGVANSANTANQQFTTRNTILSVSGSNPAPSPAGLGVTFFSQSSVSGGVNNNQELHFDAIPPANQLGVSSDTDINISSTFDATATIDNAYLNTEFAEKGIDGVMRYGPVGNNAKFVNGTYTF